MNHEPIGKRQSMLAYLVPLALMWPSVIWIAVDRSVWSWDPAAYGKSAVELFADLIDSPGHWVTGMLATLPWTAPGIAWFGQLFVPLGYLTGSIDRGLLGSIWLTQGLTLCTDLHITLAAFQRQPPGEHHGLSCHGVGSIVRGPVAPVSHRAFTTSGGRLVRPHHV